MHPRATIIDSVIKSLFTEDQIKEYGSILGPAGGKGWTNRSSTFYTELPPNPYNVEPGDPAPEYWSDKENAAGDPLYNQPSQLVTQIINGVVVSYTAPVADSPVPPPIGPLQPQKVAVVKVNPASVGPSDQVTVSVKGYNLGQTVVYWFLNSKEDLSQLIDGAVSGQITLTDNEGQAVIDTKDKIPQNSVIGITIFTDAQKTVRLGSSQFGVYPADYGVITLPTEIKAGSAFTTSYKAAGAGEPHIVYWRYEGGNFTEDDFSPNVLSGSITLNPGETTNVQSILSPNFNKTTPLQVKVYADPARTELLEIGNVVTLTTNAPKPTYTLTFNPGTLASGSILSVKVAATNVVDGQFLYWGLSGVTQAELGPNQALQGVTTLENGEAFFDVQMASALTQDGTMVVSVYTDDSYQVIVGTKSINFTKDPVASYALAGSTDSLEANQTVTYTVTTKNVAPSTTISWRYLYEDGTQVAVEDFTDGKTSDDVVVGADGTATWQSTFTGVVDTKLIFVGVYETQQGTASLSNLVRLSLNGVPVPTYTLSSDPARAVESDNIVNSVATTNVDDGTNLYWTYVGKDLTPAYFTDGQLSGSVQITNNLGEWTSTVSTGLANNVDMTILLFRDSARTDQVAQDTVRIDGASPYILTTTPPSMGSEDVLTNVVVAREPGATPTRLYWSYKGDNLTPEYFTNQQLSGSFDYDQTTYTWYSTTAATLPADIEMQVGVYAEPTFDTALSNIENVSITAANYELGTYPLTVGPGDRFTNVITGSDEIKGTTVYWEYSGAGVSAELFIGKQLTGQITLDASTGKASFSDTITTTVEALVVTISLYKDAARTKRVGNIVSLNVQPQPAPSGFSGYISPSLLKQNSAMDIFLYGTDIPQNYAVYTRFRGIDASYVDNYEFNGLTDVDGNFQFNATIKDDLPSFDEKQIFVDVYSDALRTNLVGSTDPATLKPDQRTYTMTTQPTEANPNNTITSTVKTTNVLEGDKIYWAYEGITADYFTDPALTGEATIDADGEAVFTKTVVSTITQDSPAFQIKIYSDAARATTALASNTVTIHQAPKPPTYSIVVNPKQATNGTVLIGTITTTNLPSEELFYRISIEDPSWIIGPLEGIVSIVDDTGTIPSVTIASNITGEAEDLQMKLYQSEQSVVPLGVSNIVVVTPTVPEIYELTTTPSGTAYHGNTIINRVKMTDVPVGTVVSWEYTGDGLNSSYFQDGKLNGTFTADSTQLYKWESVLTGDFQVNITPMTITLRDSDGNPVGNTQQLNLSTTDAWTLTSVPPVLEPNGSFTNSVEATLASTDVDTQLWWKYTGPGDLSTYIDGALEGPINHTAGVPTTWTSNLKPSTPPNEGVDFSVAIYQDSQFLSRDSNIEYLKVVNRTYNLDVFPLAPSAGEIVTNKIRTTFVDQGTVIYWQYSGVDVVASDFEEGTLTGSVEIDSSGRAAWKMTVANDVAKDATVTVKLFLDAAMQNQVGNEEVFDLKAQPQPPEYDLSLEPSGDWDDGTTFTSDVLTKGHGANELYWEYVIPDGYVVNNIKTGTVTLDAEGSGSFSSKLVNTLPGAETLTVNLYTDAARQTPPVATASNPIVPDELLNVDVETDVAKWGEYLVYNISNGESGEEIYYKFTGVDSTDLGIGTTQGSLTLDLKGAFRWKFGTDRTETQDKSCTLQFFKDEARTVPYSGAIVVSLKASPVYTITSVAGDILPSELFIGESLVNTVTPEATVGTYYWTYLGDGSDAANRYLASDFNGVTSGKLNFVNGHVTQWSSTLADDAVGGYSMYVVITQYPKPLSRLETLATTTPVISVKGNITGRIDAVPAIAGEGSTITTLVSVAEDTFGPGSTLYWTYTGVDASYFTDQQLEGTTTVGPGGEAQFSSTIANVIPGDAKLHVYVYADPARKQSIGDSDVVDIDKDRALPTFKLALDKTSYSPGDFVISNLEITNPSGQTVITPGETFYYDFQGIPESEVPVNFQGSATVSEVNGKLVASWSSSVGDPLVRVREFAVRLFSDIGRTNLLTVSNIGKVTRLISAFNATLSSNRSIDGQQVFSGNSVISVPSITFTYPNVGNTMILDWKANAAKLTADNWVGSNIPSGTVQLSYDSVNQRYLGQMRNIATLANPVPFDTYLDIQFSKDGVFVGSSQVVSVTKGYDVLMEIPPESSLIQPGGYFRCDIQTPETDPPVGQYIFYIKDNATNQLYDDIWESGGSDGAVVTGNRSTFFARNIAAGKDIKAGSARGELYSITGNLIGVSDNVTIWPQPVYTATPFPIGVIAGDDLKFNFNADYDGAPKTYYWRTVGDLANPGYLDNTTGQITLVYSGSASGGGKPNPGPYPIADGTRTSNVLTIGTNSSYTGPDVTGQIKFYKEASYETEVAYQNVTLKTTPTASDTLLYSDLSGANVNKDVVFTADLGPEQSLLTEVYFEYSGDNVTGALFSNGQTTGSATVTNLKAQWTLTTAATFPTTDVYTVAVDLYSDAGRTTKISETQYLFLSSGATVNTNLDFTAYQALWPFYNAGANSQGDRTNQWIQPKATQFGPAYAAPSTWNAFWGVGVARDNSGALVSGYPINEKTQDNDWKLFQDNNTDWVASSGNDDGSGPNVNYNVSTSNIKGADYWVRETSGFTTPANKNVVIGGWGLASFIDSIPDNPGAQDRFNAQIVSYINWTHATGVDIDYEPTNGVGPSAGSSVPLKPDKILSVLTSLRSHLDSTYGAGNKKLTITLQPIAGDPIVDQDNRIATALTVKDVVDGIHIMTYDDRVPFSANKYKGTVPNYHSHVNESLKQVLNYVSAGVPASKVSIGIASYGRPTELAIGTSSTYGQIVKAYENLAAGDQNDLEFNLGRFSLTDQASADSPGQVVAGDHIWTFDTMETIARKVKSASQLGLAGVILWEMNFDYYDPNNVGQAGEATAQFAVSKQIRNEIDNL